MASWRMNFGFVGWSMAQTRRIVRRRMKLKTKRQAQNLRSRMRRILPWLPQSFAVMVLFGFLSECLMKMKKKKKEEEGLREKWRRGTFLSFCCVIRECLATNAL